MQGQVALVTGGSRGIGLAAARALAASGCSCALLGRNRGAVEAAAAAIGGSGHTGLSCDVSDNQAVDRAVREVASTYGKINHLVHSAGISRDALLTRARSKDQEAMWATNVSGTFYVTRAATRHLLRAASEAATVTSVGSIVGLDGNAGQTGYAATKAALVGFTKSLARELGPRGVRVNLVAPGFVETDMTREMDEARRAAVVERTLLGRMGSPEDVARAIAFLTSPDSSFITGQVLRVDGGLAL